MSKFAEISLIAGLAIAVLVFGGVEAISFSIVEVIFFGTAAWLLVTSPEITLSSKKTAFIPVVLSGIVLLQLCPLPAALLHRVAGREVPPADIRAEYLTFEPYATRTHFLILLTCFIAFYLAQVISQDRRRKQFFIGSLVALGTFEAFYGLVQYLSGWQQIFAYVKKFDLEEATGTYINRNHYAGFLEMILPFSLAFGFYEFAKLRGDRDSKVNLRSVIGKSANPKIGSLSRHIGGSMRRAYILPVENGNSGGSFIGPSNFRPRGDFQISWTHGFPAGLRIHSSQYLCGNLDRPRSDRFQISDRERGILPERPKPHFDVARCPTTNKPSPVARNRPRNFSYRLYQRPNGVPQPVCKSRAQRLSGTRWRYRYPRCAHSFRLYNCHPRPRNPVFPVWRTRFRSHRLSRLRRQHRSYFAPQLCRL